MGEEHSRSRIELLPDVAGGLLSVPPDFIVERREDDLSCPIPPLLPEDEAGFRKKRFSFLFKLNNHRLFMVKPPERTGGIMGHSDSKPAGGEFHQFPLGMEPILEEIRGNVMAKESSGSTLAGHIVRFRQLDDHVFSGDLLHDSGSHDDRTTVVDNQVTKGQGPMIQCGRDLFGKCADQAVADAGFGKRSQQDRLPVPGMPHQNLDNPFGEVNVVNDVGKSLSIYPARLVKTSEQFFMFKK
jgi:hypothetical protein